MIHQVKFQPTHFQRSRFFVVRGALLHQGQKVVLEFLVDTGATITIVPTSAFQTLNIPFVHHTKLTGIVAAPGPYPVGTVERVLIGSASATDVVVVGVDLPPGLKVK